MVKALKNKPITPRIHVEEGGKIHYAVSCRHCLSCMLLCPYGCITTDENETVLKCELCTKNGGIPACVQGCPNRAIVFEEVQA